FVEELLLDVRPELGHQVAHDAAGEAGRDTAHHDGTALAGGGIVEVRSRDAHHHAADAGRVEDRRTGILARDDEPAHRIHRPPDDAGTWALAVIPRVLMEDDCKEARAEEILSSEIGQCRAEAAAIGVAALALL